MFVITKRLYCLLLLTPILLCAVSLAQTNDPNSQVPKEKYYNKFSLKGGIHSSDNEHQNSFPYGWIVDASYQRMLNQIWSIGAGGEFWERTSEIIRGGILYSARFSAYHFDLQVLFTSRHKILDFSIGGTAGKYSIHYGYTGFSTTDNYLSLGLIISPEYKLNKHFTIAGEISFSRLVNNDQHASLFNFKVGPAFKF